MSSGDDGFIRRTVLPSKYLSALWPGRKNWNESWLIFTEVRLVTFDGLCIALLSGFVSSPSRMSEKKPTMSCATNNRSS